MTEEEKLEELKLVEDTFEDHTFSTICQEGKAKSLFPNDDKEEQKVTFSSELKENFYYRKDILEYLHCSDELSCKQMHEQLLKFHVAAGMDGNVFLREKEHHLVELHDINKLNIIINFNFKSI